MGDERNGNDIALSKRKVKGIMHEHSGRISDDAAIRIAYLLERRTLRMTKAAKVVANAAGRETVREEDIRRVNNIMDVMDGED